MIFPGDFVRQCVPRGSTSSGDIELDALFEDHGVSWLAIDEMFALEWATYRRCFQAQPLLSALQRYIRRKCAHLLRDLAATADLPPNSALFSQQLLDLAHRWFEREDNDIDIGDFHPLAAAVYIHIKLHSARYPDAVPYQFPDPQQLARPLADLLIAIAALSLDNSGSCRRRISYPGSVNDELCTPTQAAWIQVFKQCLSLWCQQQLQLSQRPLLSLVPPDVLARVSQDVADVHVFEQPFNMDSRPSHVGARGSSRARSASVSKWLECA